MAWSPGSFDGASEQQLAAFHNQARANAGLPALSVRPVTLPLSPRRRPPLVVKGGRG